MAEERNEGRSSSSSSNPMDLNLYLSLSFLRRSQSCDLGSDLSLNSARLPSSPFAEENHAARAPYSPSNALSAPDMLPTDHLHAADTANPVSEINPYPPSREPNDASFTPEPQSIDDRYPLPGVNSDVPLIREPSHAVPPPQFAAQPSSSGVDGQIGRRAPPHLSPRIGHRQVEAVVSFDAYSQIRLSELTAQGDSLSVQQELREHPEYRFQRLIELTNRLWSRSHRSANDGQRFDSGAHSLTSPERLMHDIVQSQRALEAAKKDAEGKVAEDSDKRNEDNAAANFECNICYELAKDPVVTPCGHLFCWACLYKWLHAHSLNSECPVCKGQVLEVNVTPIYGRGVEEIKDHKQQHGENGESCLKIPPRPHAIRTENFGQELRGRLGEGIANSWRQNLDAETDNGPRTEGSRPSSRRQRIASTGVRRRSVRRLQREEGSGSNSAEVGLRGGDDDDALRHVYIPAMVFHSGFTLPHHQQRHGAGPLIVADQASASSAIFATHADATGANPSSAGASAAGSSNSGRRRARNSGLVSSATGVAPRHARRRLD